MRHIRSTLGGTPASWWVRSTPDRAVAVLALVYKLLGIGKVNAVGSPSMDEHPTRGRGGGRRNGFKLKRPKIRAGHFTYLPYTSSWSVQRSCCSSLFTYWSAIMTGQRGRGSLELHSYHGNGYVVHPCNIHEPNTCTILISSLFCESTISSVAFSSTRNCAHWLVTWQLSLSGQYETSLQGWRRSPPFLIWKR